MLVDTGMPPKMTPPSDLPHDKVEFDLSPFLKWFCYWASATQIIWKTEKREKLIIKFPQTKKKSNWITWSTIGVLMYQEATALLLILSSAHPHAKFFVSWFIAPEKSQNDNDNDNDMPRRPQGPEPKNLQYIYILWIM